MKKARLLSLIFVFLLGHVLPGWAQEGMAFNARIERSTASVGNPLYLYLEFRGAQDVDAPDIPQVDGLNIKYIGPTTSMTIVNGKMSRSITHTYLVFPRREGTYKIGPFRAEQGGKVYEAPALDLSITGKPAVTQQAGQPPMSSVPDATSVPAYTGDNIFLSMSIDKNSLYVNESAILTIKLYVDGVGLRDIEFPAYAHEGFSGEDFNEPQRTQETVGGRRYEVLVFRQNIFAIKEGEYEIGPARLNCKMLVRKQVSRRRSSLFGMSVFNDDFFDSAFGGYDVYPVELESKGLNVSVLPFPSEGKPLDFKGAVGYFDMDASIDPIKVNVGDPVVLKTIISGSGNMDTVTSPSVNITDDLKTYEPDVSRETNKKVYEQVIIPKSDKVTEIPEVSFSFFNPASGRYKTIKKGPFPISVMKPSGTENSVKMVTLSGKEQVFYPQEKIGQDIIHIKDDTGEVSPIGGYLYRNPLFLPGHLLVLVLFGIFFGAYRKSEKMRTDKKYARFTKAPGKAKKGISKAESYLKKGDMELFYDTLTKALGEYVSGKLDLPKGNVTVDAVRARVEGTQKGGEIISMLGEVLAKCEMARYAAFDPDKKDGRETLEKTKKLLVYLEKIKI
ncbi:MAG: BatD family protein [Candidatus Omnitrophica bacterium]|nr:BatD family protein [Candidatus Omnitrophota bacterium]MDD5487517.1 BatD family protein [Candidatus Omnitrophota bacterium]